MVNLIMSICASMNAYNSVKLDCNTVLAIAHVESSLNPNAVGRSHGEVGLFQLRPEFHKCAKFEPATNTRCAISYLRKLKKRHGSCYVTYYNTGSNSGIKYPCLHKYYKKVTKVYKKLTDK